MIKKLFLRAASVMVFTATALSASSSNAVTDVAHNISIPVTDGLEEIKNMDKSALTGSERRDLRKEVRAMKKEMKSDGLGRGVYLSVGAIIIIILLLILIL
jgi:hypothetical protein